MREFLQCVMEKEGLRLKPIQPNHPIWSDPQIEFNPSQSKSTQSSPTNISDSTRKHPFVWNSCPLLAQTKDVYWGQHHRNTCDRSCYPVLIHQGSFSPPSSSQSIEMCSLLSKRRQEKVKRQRGGWGWFMRGGGHCTLSQFTEMQFQIHPKSIEKRRMRMVYVRGHCTSLHQISPQAPYVTTSHPDSRVAKV